MSRIKKRGLDYFPLNTDFIRNRLVRRILKREGDAALAVLLQTLCSIYSDEGYYVQADRFFYEDLADCLYRQEATDVERILRLAVEYGLFDARLFNEWGVLTSADIQRQFLFITKRRNAVTIDDRYNLLATEEASDKAPAAPQKTAHSTTEKTEEPTEAATANVSRKAQNVTESADCVTFQPENNEKLHFGTQSKAKHSKEKHSKAKKTPSSIVPPETEELKTRTKRPRRMSFFWIRIIPEWPGMRHEKTPASCRKTGKKSHPPRHYLSSLCKLDSG